MPPRDGPFQTFRADGLCAPPKGEIVIPQAIRKALHSRESEQFDIQIEGNRLVLVSHSHGADDWHSLRGAFGKSGEKVDAMLAANRKQELDPEERKLAGLRS